MNETTMLSANTLLEQAMEAHGGLERWQKVNKVSLNITAGGLVFFIKGRNRNVGKPFTADIYTIKKSPEDLIPLGFRSVLSIRLQLAF